MEIKTRNMDFQTRFIEDESENILVEKSRQIGLSESCAIKAVRNCIRSDARLDWYILSRDEGAAKQFLEDCKKWAEFYAKGAWVMGSQVIEEDTIFKLSFKTGVSIYVLTSNPDRLAGKRGNVVLDEFALHKDQQKLLKVSSAVTQWGGQRIVISTHRGKKSVFYALCKDAKHRGNPMGWSHYRITIDDAIQSGIVERINKKSGKKMTREEFRASCRAKCFTDSDFEEEYCCNAQADEGQLIPWEHITGAINTQYASIRADLSELGKAGLGVDVARKVDKHGYLVVEERLDKYVVRMIYYHEDKSWQSRDKMLDHLLSYDCIRRAQIDQTGIGDKYVEDAKLRKYGWKIHGVMFTNEVKEHLAIQLARLFEEGKMLIPDHELLKRHLAAIVKKYTKTGMISFDADHSEDGHADLFWSLAMAVDALLAKAGEGVITADNVGGIMVGKPQGGHAIKRRILTIRR